MKIKTVSDSDIESVKDDPIKLNVLHYGEIYKDELEDFDDTEKVEILNWRPISEGEIFHLEAAFESIHYLLTGKPEWNSGKFPLNFLTGQKLSIGEIGWGPARFYYSEEVKQINEALKKTNKEKLLESYSSVDFNSKGIYPRGYIWKDSDGIELINKIKSISDFLEKAVTNNKGIYITIE